MQNGGPMRGQTHLGAIKTLGESPDLGPSAFVGAVRIQMRRFKVKTISGNHYFLSVSAGSGWGTFRIHFLKSCDAIVAEADHP
jgi:hypothetical protein